jgi:hypothetical protein
MAVSTLRHQGASNLGVGLLQFLVVKSPILNTFLVLFLWRTLCFNCEKPSTAFSMSEFVPVMAQVTTYGAGSTGSLVAAAECSPMSRALFRERTASDFTAITHHPWPF